MPSARADEFRRAAAKWGSNGRGKLIHGGREIGAPLFYRILGQLGIDEETFDRLR